MAGLFDMARMTVSGTPGTGTITLLAADTGFQTFAAAGVPTGKIVSYSAGDSLVNGVFTVWEVGRGTYTLSGLTLTRGALFSSSGGSAVSLSSSAVVAVVALAEDLQPPITYAAPTTGSTLTATTGQAGTICNPAGAIAALTQVMPPSAVDRDVFSFATTQTITAMTFSPAATQSMAGSSGGPYTLSANGGVSFWFRSADSTWYPRS